MVAPQRGEVINVLHQPNKEASKWIHRSDRHNKNVIIRIAKQNETEYETAKSLSKVVQLMLQKIYFK